MGSFTNYVDQILPIIDHLPTYFPTVDIGEVFSFFDFFTYSRVWNKRTPLNKHIPWKIWQKE